MKFVCDLCRAECCNSFVITVTSFDVLRIANNTGKNPEDFSYLRRLDMLKYEDSMLVEVHDEKYPDYYLLSLKSHPCVFLKEDKCSIQSFKPLSCRLYPVMGNGKKSNRTLCPAFSGILFSAKNGLLEKHNEEKELYKKMVGECNSKKLNKKDAFDFIMKNSANVLQNENKSGE